MSIRSRLAMLVVALALPAGLLAIAVAYNAYRDQRTATERSLQETTRALALTVDREIAKVEATARILAGSSTLLRDDISGFYTEALAVTDERQWVVLYDRERVLLHTRRPLGAPLPAFDPRQTLVVDVFVRDVPALSDLYRSAVVEGWTLSFAMHVRVQGRTRYGVSVAFDPERYVGAPARPLIAAGALRATERPIESVTLEGIPVLSALGRSPTYGLTFLIGVPLDDVRAIGRQALVNVALGAGLLLVAGIAFALLMANRIVRPIQSLARAAAALGARDAMPHGGTLTLATANVTFEAADPERGDLPHGEYLQITVADTGHGMEPATAGRAFEPFFTTKPVGQGTRLGLATVYGTVRQLGGDLRLHTAPGVGTRLTIYLPRAGSPAASAAVEHSESPAGAVGFRARVLLVDDDPDVRSVLAEMLRDAGHAVTEAPDAAAALAALEAAPHDVPISDYATQDTRGDELCNRAVERHPELEVVLLTGYAEAPVLAIAPDAVVRKPVTGMELQEVVAARLARARARLVEPEPVG